MCPSPAGGRAPEGAVVGRGGGSAPMPVGLSLPGLVWDRIPFAPPSPPCSTPSPYPIPTPNFSPHSHNTSPPHSKSTLPPKPHPQPPSHFASPPPHLQSPQLHLHPNSTPPTPSSPPPYSTPSLTPTPNLHPRFHPSPPSHQGASVSRCRRSRGTFVETAKLAAVLSEHPLRPISRLSPRSACQNRQVGR